MKRAITLTLVFISTLFLTSCDVFWEILLTPTNSNFKIYDSGNRKVGEIDNETVYDNYNSKVGYIDNREVYNSSNRKVGYISNSKVYNSHNSVVGKVEGKNLYDSHYRKIGYTDVESEIKGGAAILLLLAK